MSASASRETSAAARATTTSSRPSWPHRRRCRPARRDKGAAMAQVADRYVGSPVLRKEDDELVTGHGKYTDDLTMPGMVYMHAVRSPLAHARLTKVDVSKALGVPGVVGAFSGADLEGEWG